MIEVLLSDSACGSLKAAQHFGEGPFKASCVGVITGHKPTQAEIDAARHEAEEKMRSSWERTAPLGGNPANIYGFNLMLSVGDISEDWPGAKRRQTLERLYGVYPNGEGRQAAREICERAAKDLKAVRERVAAGESIRIWYSNQPDEMCGLYWFMDQINQWAEPKGVVSVIKLPEWEADTEGNIAQKSSWGEMAPEDWHRYVCLEKSVPATFIQDRASRWQELKKENASLRAVLNGQLVSVPEILYDDFILCEIASEGEEFYETVVIGRVLGKCRLGIGDCWIASRIEEMVRDGKLEVVSVAGDDMPAYHRRLRKCSHEVIKSIENSSI